MRTIWTVMRFTVGILTIIFCAAAALTVALVPHYVSRYGETLRLWKGNVK